MAVFRRHWAWGCLLAAAVGPDAGQAVGQTTTPKFPYEAVVQTEGAYVRSGPGKSYYPTDRLNRGSRVSVHRHDPGGWFMVAPPPGSFSWVRGEHVRKTGVSRGVLTADNVVVRVGSTFGDETRDVEQIRLSTGDEVEVVEQKTLQTEQGPIEFFKIRPPQGEYRWMAGQDLAAADPVVRQQQDRNPFMPPSNARRDTPAATETPEPFVRRSSAPSPAPSPPTGEVYEPRNASSNEVGARPNGAESAALTAQKQRLAELDAAFREMVNRRTGEWNFTQLEQGYDQLRREAASPAIASQVTLRTEALERYRKIKAEYDDLMKLTSESRRRDAELLSLQRQPGGLPNAVPPNSQPSPEPDPFAGQPLPSSQDGWTPSEPRPRDELAGTPNSTPPASRPATGEQPPKFDGAGVVQRTPAALGGMPQHVLVTPQGRVLAYLQGTPGVNLDQYLGRAMGLWGQRYYRQDLRADFLVVRGLTPVRLAP
jgi:hypothetical protein